MQPYQIVLADDHLLFREGLKRIIEAYPDLKVVGEVDDGLKLLELLKKFAPQMVILDISMPKLQGIEATKELKSLCPEVKVLILTMHKSREHLYRAIYAGATLGKTPCRLVPIKSSWPMTMPCSGKG